MTIRTVLIYLFEGIFNLLMLAVLARALVSWLRIDPYHPAIRLLESVTEPILRPLRQAIPPMGGIDITPIIALILLQIANSILIRLVAGA